MGIRARQSAKALATGVAVIATLVPVALAATTQEEYVAQVNPICKRAAHQANKIPSQIKPTGNRYLDFLLASQRFAKLLGKTTRQIAAVLPAPGQEVAVKAWIDGLRQQKRLIDRFLRAVGHGNAKAANVFTKRTLNAQQRSLNRAARLGLTACAGGGQAG